MFISRKSHNEIVALYEKRLAEAEARFEAVAGERDTYREAWGKFVGVRFPSPPKPSEVTSITAREQVTAPAQIVDRKSFMLDRSDWTHDDRKWFDDYHAKPLLKKGEPAEELDWLYFKMYGNQKPLAVFLDGAFPIA